MEGYIHVCQNYSGTADQILLFGYSRGAFIARCIADVISNIGVLTKVGLRYPESIDAVVHGWQNYDRSNYSARTEGRTVHAIGTFNTSDNPSSLDDRFERMLSNGNLLHRHVRVDVCALFDTVSALGWPYLWKGPRSPQEFQFIDSEFDRHIGHVFQALSLHERRKLYLPIVLRSKRGRVQYENLHQCWFMGCHSDIGGGRKAEALAFLPLIWMISRMRHYVEFDIGELHTLLSGRETSVFQKLSSGVSSTAARLSSIKTPTWPWRRSRLIDESAIANGELDVCHGPELDH
jgi:uncharacterized protein (DUF2235 family)